MSSIEQRKAELKKELAELEKIQGWEKYPKLHKYLVEQGFELDGPEYASNKLTDHFGIEIEIYSSRFHYYIADIQNDWATLAMEKFSTEEELIEAIKNLELPKRYKITGNFEAHVYSYNPSEVKLSLIQSLRNLERACENEFTLQDWKGSVTSEEVE